MRSLRRQLTTSMLVAFALLLGAGGALVYWSARASLYRQFDIALKAKALVVVTDTQISSGVVKVYFSDRFLREFDRTVATEFFQVFDEQGLTVARSDSLDNSNLPGKLRGPVDAPVYWNLTLPTAELGRAIGIEFQPRVRPGAETQDVTVVVAVSRRRLIDEMIRLRNVLIGSGVTLLLVTGAVVPWILCRGLRPLDEVGERIAKVDAGTLEQRLPLASIPAELQPVARKLNDLLARLEPSFERERRFSADLAHELRTPLAELRSQAELALKWPEERSAATDRTVLEISLQMEKMVERLLALSRLEHGETAVQRTAIDGRSLVDRLLQSFAARASEAKLAVKCEYDGEPLVTTDPVLFESIVANLIENAVNYAPPHSEVRLTFVKTAGHFSLQVSNAAPDLCVEDVPQMFDRFWRKDHSRTGTSHAGLGLALSRSFATTLGFSLSATLRPDGRLVMELLGPV